MVVLPRNVPCLSMHPLSYSLTTMSVTARVALFCSAMVSNGRKGFTEYGISVGNALSYGVNWHFHQCVRGERGDLKISRTFSFSKSEEAGPTAVSSFPVVFNGNVYKNLVLPLHPREGSCHRDGEWRNLESTSRISQSVAIVQGLLLSQKNKQYASEVRILPIFLNYSCVLPILTTQATKPSFAKMFIKCVRVILVSKIIQLSSVQFYNIAPINCIVCLPPRVKRRLNIW